jgi:hypothetical protein
MLEVDSDKFVTLCEDAELRPVLSYSGRGMYGVRCIGIEGRPGDLVKFLLQVAPQLDSKFEEFEGVLDYSPEWETLASNSMGHDTIYYWPNVKAVASSTEE